MNEAFARLEREGWERVAEQYAAAWLSLTGQFAAPLLAGVRATPGACVLDVCSGPGIVAARAAQLGARVTGLDFSEAMVRLARTRYPAIEFRPGDAERLPFPGASFDCVVMNFGVLHLPDPERAFAEAHRVLVPGGRYGFTVWARPELNVGMAIVAEAVEAHGVPPTGIPEGPDRLRYADEAECRRALGAAGFPAASVVFETHAVRWVVLSKAFLFEAQRDASVRIAAVLRAQPADRLIAIQAAVERSVERFRTPAGWEVPMAAHLVVAERR